MLTGDGQEHGVYFSLPCYLNHLLINATGLSAQSPEVGFRTETKAQAAPRKTGGLRSYPLVVGIEHQGGLPGQGLNELSFGFSDSFHTADPLGVSRINIQKHSHRRLANFSQTADFPKAVHAHLYHRCFKAPVQL